jgi:hypothetical protein
MLPNPAWPADKAMVEDDCWADVELLKRRQVTDVHYNVGRCRFSLHVNRCKRTMSAVKENIKDQIRT